MSKEEEMYEQLENWLFDQDDSCFPKYDVNQGQKSYPELYKDIRLKLLPVHNNVEKGALLASVISWKNDIAKKAENITRTDAASDDEKHFRTLLNSDPAIYLNQHGIGHVNKVIEKASKIIDNFRIEDDRPTPTEIFLLLCAIQLHDIGNIFGRKNHERSFQAAFIDIARPIIPDSATRKLIFNIARVHSGNIDGNEDTILASKLRADGMFFDKKIRELLLAALLRFADELADDSSRADVASLKLEVIPPESLIYHIYSQSLHTVSINKNEINRTLYLSLEYFIDKSTISKKYNKEGNDKLLVDEIFQRTIKMERERRYCMRFLGSYFPLEEIRVRIEIFSEFDLTDSEIITYTLKESGYPLNDIIIECPNNTGEKVLASLKKRGWNL